jgi:hypothetical protein
MRFDVKSAMKNTVEKLYRVIRTADLHLMEALGKLVTNSLSEMVQILNSKIGIFDSDTAGLLGVDPSLSREDYQRCRDDIINEGEFLNWISFDLSIGIHDTLKLTPSLLDINNYINRHVKKVVQAIAEFKKPLIMASRFEFIRKNIKGIMLSLQDKNDTPMFTFIDYLRNNKDYQSALEDLNSSLQNFIDCYQLRLTTFQPFLELYKKYANCPMPDLTFGDISQCIDEL